MVSRCKILMCVGLKSRSGVLYGKMGFKVMDCEAGNW